MTALLAVSSEPRLAEKFGSAGAAQVWDALRAVAGALAKEGDSLRILFLGEGADTAREIREAIRSAVGARAAGRPDALVIVGGHDVVPFFRLANPVTNRVVDPDPHVLNDAPYGLMTDGSELPVGRVPDPGQADLEAFLALIGGLGIPSRRGARSGVFSVVAREWAGAARRALGRHATTVRESPGWTARDPEWSQIRAACLYFNLHGFAGDGRWRAMNDDTGAWLDVVRAQDVSNRSCAGAVVFAESCYGADVRGRSRSNSLAFAFLSAGCHAFVGATGLAFGSYVQSTRPQLADHLAATFIDVLLAGNTVGQALATARRAVRGPRLTPFAQKTLDQFVLYGNPAATV